MSFPFFLFSFSKPNSLCVSGDWTYWAKGHDLLTVTAIKMIISSSWYTNLFLILLSHKEHSNELLAFFSGEQSSNLHPFFLHFTGSSSVCVSDLLKITITNPNRAKENNKNNYLNKNLNKYNLIFVIREWERKELLCAFSFLICYTAHHFHRCVDCDRFCLCCFSVFHVYMIIAVFVFHFLFALFSVFVDNVLGI